MHLCTSPHFPPIMYIWVECPTKNAPSTSVDSYLICVLTVTDGYTMFEKG